MIWNKLPFPRDECFPLGLVLKAEPSLDCDMQMSLSHRLPKWSRDFVASMIRFDAESRPTAEEALRHLQDNPAPYEVQI